MRLALLADVHADLDALRAALLHIDRLGCDRILCAGDLVGYGDQPDEVVALLREREVVCVRGNHDRWAVRDGKLAESTLAFLREVPAQVKLTLEGVSISICHGTPRSDMDPVFASDANAAVVHRLLDAAEAKVLVVGHSHAPMWLGLSGRGIVVNPGALGRTSLGGGWVCDAATGTFRPLEGERGTFGVLELPSLQLSVMRACDGAEVEVARRRF